MSGRLLPNPNVLIEYGWALNVLTHARMVPVMNTAFGVPRVESLPFDMRHLRMPLTYDLKEDAAADERSRVKARLSDDLTEAIELILKHALSADSQPSSKPPTETPSTKNPSTFLEPGEAPVPAEHGEKHL